MKLNRSALRIFQIMDYLTEKREGATLSQIAQDLNEPKTSIYDLLVTGVHMNYLRKNEKKFYIGAQTKKASKAYLERQEFIDIVSPFMVEASKEFNVSASLVFLEKTVLNYAFTVHPDDAVLVAREDSPINFIHASAAGKVLLSHLPQAQREKLLEGLNYCKFTDKTINNKTKLLEEFKATVKRGYGIDNREYSYLLQCVSAPLFKEKTNIASLSFSSLNLFTQGHEEIAEKLIKLTKKINKLL